MGLDPVCKMEVNPTSAETQSEYHPPLTTIEKLAKALQVRRRGY